MKSRRTHRTHTVSLRVTSREKAQIETTAESLRIGVSAYLRNLALGTRNISTGRAAATRQ